MLALLGQMMMKSYLKIRLFGIASIYIDSFTHFG